MKTKFSLIFLLLIVFISTSFSSFTETSSESYNIASIYEIVELKNGSKVIDDYGNINEAETILTPIKIDTGKYQVELTRLGSNFYRICDTDLVVETKYCYEYATRDDAFLNITSSYGYTFGEVIFFD